MRRILPSLGVLAALAIFAASPHLPASEWVGLGAALFGFAIVAVHILRGDEVERTLAASAASFAFAISLMSAFAAAALGGDAEAFAGAYGWAVMMGAWLAAWALLRLRQG